MGADAALLQGAIEALEGRGLKTISPGPAGRGLRVGFACSRFNGAVTMRLLEGALARAGEHDVEPGDLTVVWAPGAFELPLAALHLARAGCDAVVCLGAVVRGETGHYDFVAGQCAAGIQRVMLDTGTPIAFGVLTTDTLDQAMARSAPGPSNKGGEALQSALCMVQVARAL